MHPILAQALNELRLGRKSQAQALLARLVQQEPQLADAWVALAACLEAPDRQRYCLERALALAPEHPQALRALNALSGIGQPPQPEAQPTGETAFAAPQTAPESDDAAWMAQASPAEAEQSPWLAAETAEFPAEERVAETGEPAAQFADRSTIPLGAGEFDLEQFQAEWQAESAPTEKAPTGADQVAQWLQELPPVPGVPAAEPTAAVSEQALPAATEPPISTAQKPSRQAPESASVSYPWYQVWLMAVFSPSESTYQKLVADPKARPGRGYLWVYLTGLISLVANLLILTLVPPPAFSTFQDQLPLPVDLQAIGGKVLIGMLAASPLLALFSILGVMLTAAIYQLIARLMIGEGTFRELVYLLCAITAPLSLISIIFSLPIPYLSLFGAVVSLYGLLLTLLAVKAINRFGWGASCATVAAVPILVILCSCLLTILLVSQQTPVELFLPLRTLAP